MNTVAGLGFTAATSILLLGAACPASARSVPVPSPSVTTAPGLSVHVDLGLLDVKVDVPPLTDLLGGVLGGSSAQPPATRGPAAVPAPATAAPRPAPAPSTRVEPTQAAQPTPTRALPRPSASTRAPRTGGGGGVDTGRALSRTVRKSPPPAPRRSVTERQIAEANGAVQQALHPGAPAWLLMTVVGLCALGTAVVVRLGGRSDRVGT